MKAGERGKVKEERKTGSLLVFCLLTFNLYLLPFSFPLKSNDPPSRTFHRPAIYPRQAA